METIIVRATGGSIIITGDCIALTGPALCIGDAGGNHHHKSPKYFERLVDFWRGFLVTLQRQMRQQFLLKLVNPRAWCAMKNGDLLVELFHENENEARHYPQFLRHFNRKLVTLLVGHGSPSIGCDSDGHQADGGRAAAGASTRRRTEKGRVA